MPIFKKKKRSQINYLNFRGKFKTLEKEEQRKPRVCRKKGIIKIRMKINVIENRKAIEKKNQ